MERPTLEELKYFIFNKNNRFLCHTYYCGCNDGYCPRYDCGCLDKLELYTDRQWKNAMLYADANYKSCVFNIYDYALDVVEYLWNKRGVLK